MLRIVFLFILIFSVNIGSALANQSGAAPIPYRFYTRDSVIIAAHLYPQTAPSAHGRALVIIAPGFAGRKDSRVLKKLCPALATGRDVMCIDFRGTGESGGRYTFGNKDFLDLEPILAWGRLHYSSINIIGFSMGAYSAMRAVAYWPEKVAALLLISCPPNLAEIITSGGVFDIMISSAFTPGELKNRTDAKFLFRWGFPLSNSPNLRDIAQNVKTPTAFLVGGKDDLVYPRRTRKIFETIAGAKSWDELPRGAHAETLYVQNSDEVTLWIEATLERAANKSL